MSSALQPVPVATLCLLIILASGFLLRRAGKPYNGITFNIHKLVGLGVGVFLIVTLYNLNQAAGLSTPQWIAIIVTGLLFLTLAASGGLLSTDKPAPLVVEKLHQIVPFVTLASTAAMLYLLVGGGE
jgi:hypothetical protein